MKSSGLFRIGRDAEIRYLPDNTAVANVSLAFTHGKKDQEGNRQTQWIDAAMFGQRAETLAPMLLKGSQHVFHLSDCHIETFEGKNGTGHKMSARIDDVELTDRRDAPQGQQQARQAAPQQRQAPAPQQRQQAPQRQAPQRQAAGAAGSGFDDFADEEIPF